VEPIKQTDKRLPELFHKYGCRFMCLLTIPQLKTGRTLSVDEIQEIFGTCSEDKNIVSDKDMTCGKDEHKIIALSFSLLDVPMLGRQVGYIDKKTNKHIPWGAIDRGYEYILAHFVTGGIDGHWVVLDKDEEEIYDPFDPKQASYSINKRYIDKMLTYRTWYV